MARSVRKAGGDPANATPGIVGRATTKIGGSLIDTILSHVWSTVLVTPILGYLALWQTDVVPGPAEIANRIGDARSKSVTTPRSIGIAEVKALGDGTSGEMSRAVQVSVTGLLRPMPEEFGGIRVQYALGPIKSGRGASSTTSVRWALAAKGGGWQICPDVPVSFTSQRSLAEAVASQINNSLLASETGGKLQCG